MIWNVATLDTLLGFFCKISLPVAENLEVVSLIEWSIVAKNTTVLLLCDQLLALVSQKWICFERLMHLVKSLAKSLSFR